MPAHVPAWIAVVLGLPGVLAAGCVLERSGPAVGATADPDACAAAWERPAPAGGRAVAVRELPTDGFNATIRRAAREGASWAADPAQIAARFWREQVRHGDAGDRTGPPPVGLPACGDGAYVGFRMTDDPMGGGDDAIAREWIDLGLRREARTGLWRIERATASAECWRGVAGDLCL